MSTVPDKLDLFLLIGQSNMAGRGAVEPSDEVADPRLWSLGPRDEWIPGVDPLHYDKPHMIGVGPGPAFARALLEKSPASNIGLIPCAVGGTAIDEWAKGQALYDNAIRRASIARLRGTLRGVLWHQGEADSTPERITTYQTKLVQLIANVRRDLDAPNAPFIVGEVGYFRLAKTAQTTDINRIFNRLAESVPQTACASADGLVSIGDNTHFDAASARTLGRRYAEALLTL